VPKESKTPRKPKPFYKSKPPKVGSSRRDDLGGRPQGPERGIHSASPPKREPTPKRKGWSSDFSLSQSGKETPDKLKLGLQQDFPHAHAFVPVALRVARRRHD
jgi:hypothetical protein